jgi:tRNA G18 (ribose-2'-O)-methylase SpoU
MLFFKKKKFLSFDDKKRHKKCSEILKFIYENYNDKKLAKEAFLHYNQLLEWMNLPSFNHTNIKKIADRYHWHLDHTHLSLKEHNLLPMIKKCDTNSNIPFLDNAIYLDNIRSAFNIGNILRTTEALRIAQLYFGDKTPFIDNDKVKKTSMGTSSMVPCFNNKKINDLPKPIIALETGTDAINIYDFIFPENFTLVLGNEEYGISDEILEKCDYIIEIPLPGYKNSINVASAYAIAAALIFKQKNHEKYAR